jgi:hypothetical protein
MTRIGLGRAALATAVTLASIIVGCGTDAGGGVGSAMSGPQGPAGEQGIAGLNGLDGTNGVDGADGQLRIYGDGSAGALTVATGMDAVLYTDLAVNFNLQFTDLVIENGAKLVVPSGTVMRCTGTFTNHGSVVVMQSSNSAGAGYFVSGTDGAYGPPSVSVGGSVAGAGELGDNTESRGGGRRGDGVSIAEARSILFPGLIGGGGGAGGVSTGGGAGGGTLVVLAQSAILIGATGEMTADGGDGGAGSGGGGGGIIVLASPTSIVNDGSLNARGGDGGQSGNFDGAGGGGGGGIVHLLSPNVTEGLSFVTPGDPGAVGGAGSVMGASRAGGGGGGSCGGHGGTGGEVAATGTPSAAQAAASGFAISTAVNPTALF